MVDLAKPTGQQKLNKVVGGAGVAALLIATVSHFEGKRNDPYLDIVGITTVCYGETRVEMRRYSDAECDDMLAGGLADYAAPVLRRNPELIGHAFQLAAATSLAYNVGIGPADLRDCADPRKRAGYNCSTVARRFSAGDWRGACNAFLMWAKAGGKPVLLKRRQQERALCLRGLT